MSSRGTSHGHRRRHGGRRVAPIAVIVLAVGGVTAGCGSPTDSDETQLSVGDTTEGPARIEGDEFEVRVPSGAITLTVGAPERSVTTGSGQVTAPDGGALVPVTWSLDRFQTAGVTGFDQETGLSLVTGDDPAAVATIPDTTTAATGSRLVAVADDDAVEAITATYDGVEQVVSLDGTREAGIAEGLYEPSATGEREDCSQGWQLRPRAEIELECSVQAWTLPYLPGLGWADEGTTHVLVEPVVTLWKVTANGDDYRATFETGTITLAGEELDVALETGADGPASLAGRLQAPSATTPVDWQVSATFGLRSRVGHGQLDDTEVALSGGGSVGAAG